MRRALLLLPFLLLPACGNDAEDVKATYVSEASAVCDQAVQEFEELATPTTPDGFGPYADALVGIIEKAHHELAALTPPEDDRAQLEERALEPLGELVEEGKDFAGEVRAAGADQAKLLALLPERPTGKSIDVDYLREYGLDSCAEAVEKAG